MTCNFTKVRSLYSEQVDTDVCIPCNAFTLHVRTWGKLKGFEFWVIKFSLFLTFGEILGENCFVKCATHLLFRELKLKIGMGLILRWGSVQGVQSIVNGL